MNKCILVLLLLFLSSLAEAQLPKNMTADATANFRLVELEQSPVRILRKKDGNYFFDFGKAAAAKLELYVESPLDDTLMITVGELEKDLTINADAGRNIRYKKIKLAILKGTHNYKIIWPVDEKRNNNQNTVQMPSGIGEVYPFRYAIVENLPGVVDSNTVKRKMVHYPFNEKASSFISSDTILNQVWDLCKYSIKATSFTGYYIDGDRERIPYEGDALINQLSHYAVDAEYTMARRTMAYLLFHPTWPTEWSLQNVLLAWNDYLYTGNNSFIKKYYTELQKKTLMELADTSGLISTRTGKQTDDFLAMLHKKDFDGRHGLDDIVDWPQTGGMDAEKEYPGETDGFVFTNYNSVVNAFYYRNLVLMQKMAKALGKEKDAAMYARNALKVMRSFRRVFRDEKSGRIKDGDGTNHTSLHSNAFALAFGLVPVKDRPTIVAYMKSRRMACSVYGAQFLLDGLYDAGMGQYALELMTAQTKRSWYNMMRVGSTITMEAWDKIYKPNLDLTHAWGAAPANIIVRKLMGIEPLTPGFESIRIKPMTGNLTFARLTTPTIRGSVIITIDKKETVEEINITIPATTTANIYLAAKTSKSKLLVEGALTREKQQDGFFILEKILPGIHHYSVKY